MNDARCSEPGCDNPIRARGMCRSHYGVKYRAGDLPDVKRLRNPDHAISNADLAQRIGDCSICGPGIRLRVRPRLAKVYVACRRAQSGTRRSAGGPTYLSKSQKIVHELKSALLEVQRECQICGSTDALVLDHDHDCCPYRGGCPACVRGLLCHGCNVGLGFFQDDPALLERAVAYLHSRPLAG